MVQRLGRGLDVLLPAKGDSQRAGAGFPEVPVDSVSSGPQQARKIFNSTELQSLAETIRSFGVLEPILVSPKPAGGYVLIAGERRLRAARLAGLKSIPAIVKNLAQRETAVVGLIENVQRKDLNPIELAEAVAKMGQEFSMTHEEIALTLAMSRPRVSNLLRLLNLEPQIKDYIANGHLNEGQARALLAIEDRSERMDLAREIAEGEKNWTVRNLERRTKPARRDPNIMAAEEQLEKALGTKIRIRFQGRKKSGWISIHFSNLEIFEKLHEKLID